MIHARDDYMRFQDPLSEDKGGIPVNEPVFLLRAKDKIAHLTVSIWADLAEEAGADPKMVAAARDQAEKMRLWPIKQVPDM